MGFVKWHKRTIDKVKVLTGLNDYQLLWIAWFKGLFMGALLTYFCYVY